MQSMFSEAWGFSQIIGNWDIGDVTNMVDMLSHSGMYTYYYDRTLIGWAAQNVQSNVTLGAADLVFCAARGPRQSLISNHNWTIIEDRLQDESCLPNRPDDFIMTWQVGSSDKDVLIPVNPALAGYNYIVHWGDGNVTVDIVGDVSHTYVSEGTYTISIKGDFPAIQFGSSTSSASNDQKLITIEQWGNQVWQGMEQAFAGCSNLITESSTDSPVFSSQSSLNDMFGRCSNFNSDLNDWDVSNVNSMKRMCSQAEVFNGNISNWNVSSVTDMSSMFSGAKAFNQPLGNWNVSSVTNMQGMFREAYAFDQNIGNWNVSNVTRMDYMFNFTSAFNRDISDWNVSSVNNMENMLANASLFNQDLGGWDISKVTNMSNMLFYSGLSTDNYDKTLIGWAAQNVQSNITLGAQGMIYCTAADARTSLIDSHGWSINGDTYDSECARLPITILAFDAHEENEEEEVLLSWTLNANEPMHQMVLQKSFNGARWTGVYQENLLDYASGQNVEGSFTDHEMKQSQVYYRLFITEVSGASIYSQVLQVNMAVDQETNTLYYNNSNQAIVIKSKQNYAGMMQLINVRGQNVMTKEITILKNTTLRIDVDRYLSAGIYFVRFEDPMIPPTKIFVY